MPNEKIIYFHFFSAINSFTANNFVQFVANAIQEHQPTHLYFYISSPGGQIDAGFVIFNYLVSLKGSHTITMHNVGSIDSVANVIFISGHRRLATSVSSFLYHGVTYTFVGAQSLYQIKEAASLVEGMEEEIIEIMKVNSKFTQDELKQLFLQGQSKSAEFALDKGIVHQLVEPHTPPESIFLPMNFELPPPR